MIRVDGARHRELRRLFQAEFSVPRVQSQVGALRGHIAAVVAEAAAQPGGFDLVADVAVPVAVGAIAQLLDVPDQDLPDFTTKTRHLHDVHFPPARIKAAETDLHDLLGELARAQVTNPHQDSFLGRVARRQSATPGITADDLIRNVRLVVAASLQTVSSMIALGAMDLVRTNHRFALTGADQVMRAAETEELLRYWSVVHAGPRRVATAPTRVGDTAVAAGDGVIISLPAVNRDTAGDGARQGDLNRLRLASGHLGHLAFGYGPHQCLGQNLARAQMSLTWHELFARLPHLRLADPASPRLHAGAVIFGLDVLPVTT
jgi:cytochrome P450